MLRSNPSPADGPARMEARLQVVSLDRVFFCLFPPFGYNALNLGGWGLAHILNRQEMEVVLTFFQPLAVSLFPVCSSQDLLPS